MNRMYLIYTMNNPRSLKDAQFYCADAVTKMTKEFSEATIFDSHKEIWKLAENKMYGAFKVWQATAKEIFKWQLMNELPRERQ